MGIFQRKISINLKWFKPKTIQKIRTQDRVMFLQNLYELLKEGFSLNQSLSFMEILLPQYQNLIHQLVVALSQGYGLEKGLRTIGFPLDVVAQLFYAQKQARFLPALQKVIQQLEQRSLYRQRLIKALTYPIVMLVFLLVLLLGMRSFLLPHIISFISPEVYAKNAFIRILVTFFSYLPQILMGSTGVIMVVYLFVDLYLMRKPYLERSKYLLKLPLIRKWTRYYCTYKITESLGHFISGGYSLQQTIQFIVQYPIDPFLSEIAHALDGAMHQGMELSHSLEALEIFQPELKMIIYQGELTSQLATKCLMYSENLLSRMLEDIAKKLGYLQPIIFLLIAVLVMSMYLLMMLPMLTMEGL